MRLPALFFFILSSGFVWGQKKNAGFQLPIKKASSVILIDGELTEQAWFEGATATDFFMVLPMDTSKAQVKTEVKLPYDDDNLYLIGLRL
jgi:hypothetical protein